MARKLKIFMCKIMGVEGDFGFKYDPKFLSLALYYLKEYACLDAEIKRNCEFTIRAYPAAENDEKIIETIWSCSPDIIVFSAYMAEIDKTVGLCRRLKYVLPGCRIVIGGPAISDSSEFILRNSFVDVAVRTEGEDTFRELLLCFMDGGSLEKIEGIMYSDASGAHKTPERTNPVDVEKLPVIFTDEFLRDASGLVTCETSRGCRNRCHFCGVTLPGVRYYPMDRVEYDLMQLLSNGNIRRIFIGDSDFFSNRDRAVLMLDIIKRYNRHKIQIEFYSSFLGLSEELLKECREAYIHDTLRIPIQTTNERALEAADRNWVDFEHVRESVCRVMKYFPDTSAEFIYGLPGDDYEGMKESFKWCAEIGLTSFKAHRLKNLPGSFFTRHSHLYELKADEYSPHFVFSSNTFSYEDTLRVESLSRNLQGIFFFIYPSDYQLLAALGVDVYDAAENIHEEMGKWDDAYTRSSRANILEMNREGMDILLQYLERHCGLDRDKIEFLRDVFTLRYTEKTLYRFLKEAVLYSRDIDTVPSAGKYPLIPRYYNIRINHNARDFMEPGKLGEYMKRRASKIYILYSHTMPGVTTVRVRNDELMENVLRLFDGTVADEGEIVRLAANRVSHAGDQAVALVRRLFEGGFVFYCPPKYQF